MSRTLKPIHLVVIGIVAGLVGALLARQLLQPAAPLALATGTVIQPPRPLPDVALVDQHGAPFSVDRLQGRWHLMFFGFTHCGDICPTTLALLAATTKSLSDVPAEQRPQVVFVSVDAKRDTPDVIAKYLGNFDASFIGITGTQADLDAFTGALGVPSGIRMFDNGSYAVDHSAAILATNPNGQLRALFSPPHTVATLATDVRELLKERG